LYFVNQNKLIDENELEIVVVVVDDIAETYSVMLKQHVNSSYYVP
jgi:hypothetical protein